MLFCLNDIGNFKRNIKKENGFKSSRNRFSKKLIEFINRYLLSIELAESETKNATNKLKGYYYDYKFGAGGLYLKVGLAGKFDFFSTLTKEFILVFTL